MSDSLHDARRTYHFWVDDIIIDQFGPQLGPYGLAVYMALARRATRGTAFPSLKRLALDTGMSRASVKRALNTLESLGLLQRARRRDDDGDMDTTLYTLQDVSHYHTPSPSPTPQGVSPEHRGRLCESLGVGSEGANGRLCESHEGSPTKDAHLEGSSPSVSPPDGGDTHTEAEVEFQQGRRTRKTPCPGGLAEQAALAAELLTPSLLSWANDHVPTLNPHHEFERWLAYSLAHGKSYGDFGAALQHWLLHPLTHSAQMTQGPSLAQRQAEARAAAHRFIMEDDDGSIRQTLVCDDTPNDVGNLRRSLKRHAPAGLLVGTQGGVQYYGI